MRVLAYLLAPLPPSLREASLYHKTTRVIFGGRQIDEDDEQHLQRFSEILKDLRKDATFAALQGALPFEWGTEEPYDTVNPFGDFRQIDYDALWTFDVGNDVLIHTDRHLCSRIPIALLRNRPVTLADMESLGPPVPSPSQPVVDSASSSWRPQIQVDERVRAFTHRILRDFNHQWRHILRNNYNDITLRVLARAIIRLSTLNFDVREETKSRHGLRGSHVWITELPKWKPFETDILYIGNTHVIISRSIQEGFSIAQKHATSQGFFSAKNPRAKDKLQERAHHMILSIEHIMLCRVTCVNTLEHTAAEPLFNGNHGVGPPSSLALDYLIWATTPAIGSIPTALQALPIEVESIILGYVSAGPVAAAKIGCLLGLGSPFLWKDGPLNIALEEVYRNRTPWTPVESQLWFAEKKVGIVYRGRA